MVNSLNVIPNSERQQLTRFFVQNYEYEFVCILQWRKVVPEMDLYTGEADIDADGMVTRPALLTGGKLRRYQVEGLNWLKVNNGSSLL